MNHNCEGNPKISVIVPVYRVEKFLPRCIESIMAQTFKDFELILVDDGSDDTCPAICDQAAQSDSRIRVIHQQNQGLSAARNAGIETSRGQYISFVDSDDYVVDRMLEDMYERICKDGSELAICNYTYVDEDGVEKPNVNKYSPIAVDEVIDNNQAVARLCIKKWWYYIVTWNKLYSRHLFDDIRFPVGKYHEDAFVTPKILWIAKKTSILKKPLYYYVQRKGSIMYTPMLERQFDVIDAWLECCQFALDNNVDVLAMRCYNGAISEYTYGFTDENRKNADIAACIADRMRRIRKLKKQIFKVKGQYYGKIKAFIFLISPHAYCAAYKFKIYVHNKKLKYRKNS